MGSISKLLAKMDPPADDVSPATPGPPSDRASTEKAGPIAAPDDAMVDDTSIATDASAAHARDADEGPAFDPFGRSQSSPDADEALDVEQAAAEAFAEVESAAAAIAGELSAETPAPASAKPTFMTSAAPSVSAFEGDDQPVWSSGASDASPTSTGDFATVGGGDETVDWNRDKVDPAVVVYHDPYSSTCEQYRAVRARLLSLNAGASHQVIAVTSSIPEEGKSVTTLNLAIAMAEGGRSRVVLVDADLRRSSLAGMLAVPNAPGLAEVLAGRAKIEDVIQPTPFPNLKLMPAGRADGVGYGDLLGGSTTAAALAELRAAFDYTLVDTPPVTTVSDVSMIAPHSDGVLMVIEMGRTPEPTAQAAVRTLQNNKVNVLGAILTRYRDRRAHYYDRYQYYYNQA